jgi:[ribosomal protein S5]-alanine N-acetyltransferase
VGNATRKVVTAFDGQKVQSYTAACMSALPEDILTPRLILRLMEREVVDACLVGDLQRAEHFLDIAIPGELLDEPTALKYAQAQLDADPQYRPWSVRAIVLQATRTMVGHVRFHSPPDPDYLRPFARSAVEFGYHIFSEHRRNRYATEAAGAVMGWAQATFGIGRFVVCVSPDNKPSLALISHFGFTKIGQHMDEIDGLEHIYLRDVAVRRSRSLSAPTR